MSTPIFKLGGTPTFHLYTYNFGKGVTHYLSEIHYQCSLKDVSRLKVIFEYGMELSISQLMILKEAMALCPLKYINGAIQFCLAQQRISLLLLRNLIR